MHFIHEWAMTYQKDLTNITYCGILIPTYAGTEGQTVIAETVKVYTLKTYSDDYFAKKKVIKKYLPYCMIYEKQCINNTIKNKSCINTIVFLMLLINTILI